MSIGEVFCGGRELRLDRGDDAVELGADGVGVGLVENRPDEGGDPRLGGLGDLRRIIVGAPSSMANGSTSVATDSCSR